MQVSVAEIKTRFTAIAQQADAGEEVIITNRGNRCARRFQTLRHWLSSLNPTRANKALWLTGVRKTSAFNHGKHRLCRH
jgi:antitoxin (DNA-binding transcriptional repressor) of toxin-antitoxin stability system